jgi:hypothetical protein
LLELQENHEKLLLAITSAIKSINANYKDGENGFETEIKSFGKCGTERLQGRNYCIFGERKAVLQENKLFLFFIHMHNCR